MTRFISATLVVCRNSNGEILMVQEGKEHVKGKWDFPGGGLEHDESVKKCAEREVKEETGFEIEAAGFYGAYLEESDTTELPVIVFLINAQINAEGETNHDFDGEILDCSFFDPDKIKSLDLRKENRRQMLEDILEKDTLPVERLKDTRY